MSLNIFQKLFHKHNYQEIDKQFLFREQDLDFDLYWDIINVHIYRVLEQCECGKIRERMIEEAQIPTA
jgi:hypothetical protein